MRTTFDAEADAAYITLVSETEPGRSVRNAEVESTGGSVVLDFDSANGTNLNALIYGRNRMSQYYTVMRWENSFR